MNSTIFRAYDIRGIYDKDINNADAEILGKAFGTFIQQISGGRVVIGHDNRFSSVPLNDKFVDGLLSTGCLVTDIGLALTPIVHFAVINFGFDGGVIVTASHNPKEFNGFRLDTKRGLPIFNNDIQRLRTIVEKDEFIKGEGIIHYTDIYQDYFHAITERIELSRPLKVVLDCGNGTAAKFAPTIFETLGCQIIQLQCNLDGDYPVHTPDPEEKVDLSDAAEAVVKNGADLGVGFDTDGDRFGIIDEKGAIYENDLVLLLLASEVLKKHPGSKVIYDVKSSYILEPEIKKMGGIPQMIQTGHPYFKIAMEKDENIFLGAEVSGHTFIKDNYYGFDDGPFAAARVAQLLSRGNQTLSLLFSAFPRTAHTEEIKTPCPDDKKFEIEESLKNDFRTQWKTIEIDGVRVLFSSRSWALVRASNTSPYLSLRFEAENNKELCEIIDIVESRLQKYPLIDISPLKSIACRKAP